MKAILFIGQAPARPSSKHEVAGTYLHAWLRSIGFSDKDIVTHCHFYALTDIFPGSNKSGHLPPTKEQILLHRPVLVEALYTLKPTIIVPVGKMAIGEVMGQSSVRLDETIGQLFTVKQFETEKPMTCIPFSHPSGRNAWNHTHKAQVQQSLQLLRQAAFA